VISGEGYEAALRRELAEELRLDLDAVAWELLGRLTPCDDVSAFMRVYRIRADATPAYNTDDFSAVLWLTPRELLERITAGEPAKDDLPRPVRRFYRERIR
jgi:8-oxo-dGTP pyrophosphatase MutT (NUDIX family)